MRTHWWWWILGLSISWWSHRRFCPNKHSLCQPHTPCVSNARIIAYHKIIILNQYANYSLKATRYTQPHAANHKYSQPANHATARPKNRYRVTTKKGCVDFRVWLFQLWASAQRRLTRKSQKNSLTIWTFTVHKWMRKMVQIRAVCKTSSDGFMTPLMYY